MHVPTKELKGFYRRLALLRARVDTAFNAMWHLNKLLGMQDFYDVWVPRAPKGTGKDLEAIKSADVMQAHNEFTAYLICRMVDHLKQYLVEIIARILSEDKELLKKFTDKLSIHKLFEAETINEIINDFIEDTVHTLSFKSFRELIETLNSKLETKLDTKTSDFQIVSLAFEVRNLVVHADGLVDRKFIAKCVKIDPNFNATYNAEIGKKFGSYEKIYSFADKITEYISELDLALIKKFNLDVFADVVEFNTDESITSDEYISNYGKDFKPKQICKCTGNYTVHNRYGKPTSQTIYVEEKKRFPVSKIVGATYRLRLSFEELDEYASQVNAE